MDARDPLGCRCPQVEQAVVQSGTNKKIVLVLNKIGKREFFACRIENFIMQQTKNSFFFFLSTLSTLRFGVQGYCGKMDQVSSQ